MVIAVYRIDWTESERGRGQRPDGYSLHISKTLADNYISEHWERMRGIYGIDIPDEYSFPDTPKLNEVDEKTFKEVKLKGSVRYWK